MHGNAHIDQLLTALRDGQRAALGRAITLVESTREQDRNSAQELIERCLPYSGNSLRLGITGIPGVGKSTLIDALGMAMLKAGHRVAVLAVDPSSAHSSGSILGDKTRMERLGTQDAAFIRPSPTSGVLGGVARCTRETIILCEAAGYDHLLIETVGVGQNELEVDRMTDLNLLLMLSGAGDELQGIKRGIMESSDLIALTKAEGDNLTRAEAARRDLRNAVMYLPMRDGVRHPEVLLTSAVQGTGIQDLLAAIEKLRIADSESGRTVVRRKEQGLFWMHHALNTGIQERMLSDARINAALPAMETAVQSGTMSPFKAAQELLALFLDR
jgi:LAO/AO transport system kinase